MTSRAQALGLHLQPPRLCTVSLAPRVLPDLAPACLSVILDSDSSIMNSSAPALSDEVSEDQRVEEFVPGCGADQEVSQSSSPGVLTPRPPASCSSFLSLCPECLSGSFLSSSVILFPQVCLSD